jgi:20S proteasome alpha/beta subunit
VSLAKDFDENWAAQLKEKLDKPYIDAVNSIVSNRHTIAYGGTSSITLNELEAYYRDAIKVDELEKNCV